jgi:hypothetical protein
LYKVLPFFRLDIAVEFAITVELNIVVEFAIIVELVPIVELVLIVELVPIIEFIIIVEVGIIIENSIRYLFFVRLAGGEQVLSGVGLTSMPLSSAPVPLLPPLTSRVWRRGWWTFVAASGGRV